MLGLYRILCERPFLCQYNCADFIVFLFFSCSDFIVCGRDLLRGELSVCLDNCDNSFVCLRDGYNSNDCIFTAMVMVMMAMMMKIVTRGLTMST